MWWKAEIDSASFGKAVKETFARMGKDADVKRALAAVSLVPAK